jgi:hypothetical protein
MSNRVINRRGARELTAEEMERVAAGQCVDTTCHSQGRPTFDDVICY